jgi:hypothetical protein
VTTNRSSVFHLTNLKISCVARHIEIGPPYVTFENIGFATPGANLLEPTQSRPYACPFNRTVQVEGTNAKILAADIVFESEYDSPWPWGTRTSINSDSFTLNTKTIPPQWMPGAPLL